MPDIMTVLDRLTELSRLLLEMSQEKDNKKFWELTKRFDEVKAIHKLEDELNKI